MPDEKKKKKKHPDLSKRKIYSKSKASVKKDFMDVLEKQRQAHKAKNPLHQHHLNNVKNSLTYKWPEGSKNAKGEDMTGKESSLYTTTAGMDTGTDTEHVVLFPRIFGGKLLSFKDALKKSLDTGVYKKFRNEKEAQIYNDNLPFRKQKKKSRGSRPRFEPRMTK